MNFFRSRMHPTEDASLPKICFDLSRSGPEKFDERYGRDGWKWQNLDRQIAYRPSSVFWLRRPNDENGRPVFQAYVEIQGEDKFLRLSCRPDSNAPYFFAFYLDIAQREEFENLHGLEIEMEVSFSGQGGNRRFFWELCDQLESLAPVRKLKRRELNQELKLWNTFLEASYKIVKEKTVLLPITSKIQKRRRRGTEIWEFEWNPEHNWAVLEAYFSEFSDLEYRKTQEKGVLVLPADAEPQEELLNKWDDLFEENAFVWSKEGKRFFLPLQIEPKFQNETDRMSFLRAWIKENELSGRVEKGGKIKVDNWVSFRHFRQKSQDEGLPHHIEKKGFESFEVTYSLERDHLRKEFVEKQVKRLEEDEHFLNAEADYSWSRLEIKTVGESAISPKPDSDFWHLLKVEGELFLPESEELELKLPHNARLVEGVVKLNGKNAKVLNSQIHEVLKVLDKSDIPFEKDILFSWKFQIIIPSTSEWKRKLQSEVQKTNGLVLEKSLLNVTAENDGDVRDRLRQIKKAFPLLIFEQKGIFARYKFQAEDERWVEQNLKRLGDQLLGRFGRQRQRFNVKKAGKIWRADSELQFSEREKLQFAKLSLFSAHESDTDFAWSFPKPDGELRMEFFFSKDMLERKMQELWKNLRGCSMKFLTEQDRKEYEKESSGKGGNFRGGTKLGRLKSLRNERISIVLGEQWEDENPKVSSGYLLPVFAGDLSTISRMKWGMGLLRRPKDGFPKLSNLPELLFAPDHSSSPQLPQDNIQSDEYWYQKHELNEKRLNPAQKRAIKIALGPAKLSLVQGPPGTGKTTVIAEIIWLFLQENPDHKILVASQSHLAVDNALSRLYKKNLIRPLRVAGSSYAKKSIEPEGQKYVKEIINKWSSAGHGTKEEKENGLNAVSIWMDRIASNVKIEPEFEEIQQKWTKELKKADPGAKQFFTRHYLDNVNIVAATCLECGRSEFQEDFSSGFDCVLVDEASKATPPELLLPLLYGRKIVIIGDHKQLPPMVEDRELSEVLRESGETKIAEKIEELKTAQFEKLFAELGDPSKTTLNIQYRMHKQIMQVINPFYAEEGGLKCGIEETMDLPSIHEGGSRWHGLNLGNFLSPENHVLWVDVKSPEINHSPSFSNPGEAQAIRQILLQLESSPEMKAMLEAAEKPEDREIGIISFYGKQIEVLKELKEEFQKTLPIRLRTVDKFQGMERNIMIVSTVRSDIQKSFGDKTGRERKNKSIGFANDFRRINVAFSRARKLLIIVGNESHFSQNKRTPVYAQIKEVIGRNLGRISINQITKSNDIRRRK